MTTRKMVKEEHKKSLGDGKYRSEKIYTRILIINLFHLLSMLIDARLFK